MDRRTFLTVLGAVGVLNGTPTWLRDRDFAAKILPSGIAIPDDDDVSPWLGRSDMAVYGREQTVKFEVTNTSLSEPANVSLERFDNHEIALMTFYIAPGGALEWRAYPDHPIVGPVKIVMPPHVSAAITGTDSLGRLVYATKDRVVPLYA